MAKDFGGSRALSAQRQEAEVGTRPWPGGARFALFLSHDVDMIYDRELFRLLGDLNHLRRVWTQGEAGNTVACIRRVARALFRPREPGQDVEAILSIERAHGLRSTFFLLEDQAFNRLGGRYRYSDPATKRIASRIEASGCEIAMHGAYHNSNDPQAYRTQAGSFRAAFGREPKGVRNHYLRHDGVETWKAQCEAGFQYDATFGLNERAAIRDGVFHPFFALGGASEEERAFVVLPMTIMDCSLFWGQRLDAARALAVCRELAQEVMEAEGLLCLNWHNSYFNDEEYRDWQDVYENLVVWLRDQGPWNATGEEIASWWIHRNDVGGPAEGEAGVKAPKLEP